MASSHHAMLTCVIKIEPGCHACKMHTFEILSTVDGVYDISIDAPSRTARIIGEVNPNYCIKALSRCGIHAELLSVNLKHPRLSRGGLYGYDSYGSYPRIGRSSYDNDYYGSYNNGYLGDSYRSRSLPEGMWHDYPTRGALPEYSYNTNHLYGGSPSYYPPRADYYDSYADQGMSSCTIM